MAPFSRTHAPHPTGTGCLALSLLALTLASVPFSTAQAAAPSAKGAPIKATLLVLPYASIHGMLPTQIGEKSAQFLETEIGNAPDVRLVQLKRPKDSATVANPTPARDTSLLNQSRQSAVEAQAALDNGDFPLAIVKFTQAIELERSQHPYIEFPNLVRQYIGLAVASFQLGEEDEGARYLEEAARLDPTFKLDDSLPPIFVNAFEELVQRIREQPRAGINVTSSIEGARVFLDGREIGRTPLKRADLVAGTHYLRVVPEEGSTIWAQPVELISGQALKVTARIDLVGGALAEIDRELSQNQLSRKVALRASELARGVGATHVVLGGVHQEKGGIALSSFLLSVRDQTVCPLEKALFDAGMLSAGIEIYKVGADLLSRLNGCQSPRRLPTPVAPGAPTRTAQASLARPDALTAFLDYEHAPSAKQRRATEEKANEADAPRQADLQPPVAAVTLGDEPGSATPWREEQRADAAALKKDEGTNLTWLWITLGVVAAAGLATGGYFIYDASQNPLGQGTVSWVP